MDELKGLQRENGRLKMQLELLKQKLYQVCLSHDYITGKFRSLGIPMTSGDNSMMEATGRIMKATSTEEVETIYNEMSKRLWKDKFESKPKKSGFVEKVFFFPTEGESIDSVHGSIMDALQKMISELDAQISKMEGQDSGFSLDEREEPEDPMDRTDDLKPPF
jgi:hypothetical protein